MKKKTKKIKRVDLTDTQICHLIYGAVRNAIDVKSETTKNGYRFAIIPACVDPTTCIAMDETPESNEEVFDIADAHRVLDLMEFIENISIIKSELGEYFRCFETIDIDAENVGDFVDVLGEIDTYWANVDSDLDQEDAIKAKTLGKNFVEGNETVN